MSQLIKKEDVKIESHLIITQIERHDNLKIKVVETVETLLKRLPEDLSKLEVVNGDKMEQTVQGVLNKMSDASKKVKDSRMEYTRIFDNVKRNFTSIEKEIEYELSKLNSFVLDWNSEKLKRQREEEEKIRKFQLEKERLINLRSDIRTYYLTLVIKFYNENKESFQNKFYSFDSEEKLKEWSDKIKRWNPDSLFSVWNRWVSDSTIVDRKNEKEVVIEKEILEGEIQNCITEKINDFKKDVSELLTFIPSRIEQIKSLDAKSKEEEAKKLKEKQEKERLESEAKMRADAEAKKQEEKIEAVVNSIEAEPDTQLSKGASVKLKYYPENHSELLKIINWYIHNEYKNEDFDKLNNRLSFMRAAADRALNNDGEIIDGVTHKEELKKRRTK